MNEKILPLVSNDECTHIDEGEQLVLCPVCRDPNVHFEKPSFRNDGSEMYIGMWCEGGHYWNTVMSFHKGNTFITTRDFKKDI